jgi:hypothetical protein
MELIFLVPMLIIVFVGVVMIFVAATALFPVALATILVVYLRKNEKGEGPIRRFKSWWQAHHHAHAH